MSYRVAGTAVHQPARRANTARGVTIHVRQGSGTRCGYVIAREIDKTHCQVFDPQFANCAKCKTAPVLATPAEA